MSLYTIGDLHLSECTDKPMDIFGGVWQGYREKIIENWQNTVGQDDVVVICGDLSWGINLSEARLDFQLLEQLNGKKILLKGNHDLWWDTIKKMKAFFHEINVNSIDFLHNNCYFYKGVAICGSRGWAWEEGEAHDEKIWNRELQRLEASIMAARRQAPHCEIDCFLHYPPVQNNGSTTDFETLMQKYGVRRCFYGHLHGIGLKNAFVGNKDKVDYKVVSADYLNFKPIMVIK